MDGRTVSSSQGPPDLQMLEAMEAEMRHLLPCNQCTLRAQKCLGPNMLQSFLKTAACQEWRTQAGGQARRRRRLQPLGEPRQVFRLSAAFQGCAKAVEAAARRGKLAMTSGMRAVEESLTVWSRSRSVAEQNRVRSIHSANNRAVSSKNHSQRS